MLSTGDSGETELVDSRGDRRWIPALRWDHDLPETRAEAGEGTTTSEWAWWNLWVGWDVGSCPEP